ncbi:hypothetical protein C2845_PM15G24630 [Panicum miliaceum]|uniref:RING-type domain-containing protein n=1 Tax=Panicum miliaceum TaxID=4540 RepID=A0A3L6Q5P9_PANMI|nr:hypothetical protein C2845_PM15G24630 [Panicum miliaceum]
MPELRGLADPSPSNWDQFVPDFVAPAVLRVVRENDDRGMCGGHYRFLAEMDLEVTLVFSEPKAVLRHCREEVMHTVEPDTGDACGICLDGLASSGSRTAPPVNLPCGHAFH